MNTFLSSLVCQTLHCVDLTQPADINFTVVLFVLLQNDIIDCEISTSYPVGFTDCHDHNSRDRIALVDCGKEHFNKYHFNRFIAIQ